MNCRIFSFMALLTVCITVSCHTPLEEATNASIPSQATEKGTPFQVEVVQGTLHFANAANFHATIEAMTSMDAQALTAWEEQIGFYSLRRGIEGALDALAAAETEEGYYAAAAEHAAYLTYTAEGVYRPRVQAAVYQQIADLEGIYYIAGYGHRVRDHQLLVSKLPSLTRQDLTPVHPQVEVINYDLSVQGALVRGRLSSGDRVCPTRGNEVCDKIRHAGKRELHVRTHAYLVQGSEGALREWAVWFQIHLWGEKKNIWGNFKPYRTDLEYRKANYTCSVPVRVNATATAVVWELQELVPFGGFSREAYDHYHTRRLGNRMVTPPHLVPTPVADNLADNYTPQYIDHYVFRHVSMEATSRGIGDNWLLVNCIW